MASGGSSGPPRHPSHYAIDIDGDNNPFGDAHASNKRSYREYDGDSEHGRLLDVADPLAHGESSGSSSSSGGGNERNKRPRSERGEHDDAVDIDAPGPSSSSSGALTLTRPSSANAPPDELETLTYPDTPQAANLPSPLAPVLPPHSPRFMPFTMRPPTPDMALLARARLDDSHPPPFEALVDNREEERNRPLPEPLRRSMERMAAFDSELAALRRSPATSTHSSTHNAHVHRSAAPTPPPTLPPLAFEDVSAPVGPSSPDSTFGAAPSPSNLTSWNASASSSAAGSSARHASRTGVAGAADARAVDARRREMELRFANELPSANRVQMQIREDRDRELRNFLEGLPSSPAPRPPSAHLHVRIPAPQASSSSSTLANALGTAPSAPVATDGRSGTPSVPPSIPAPTSTSTSAARPASSPVTSTSPYVDRVRAARERIASALALLRRPPSPPAPGDYVGGQAGTDRQRDSDRRAQLWRSGQEFMSHVDREVAAVTAAAGGGQRQDRDREQARYREQDRNLEILGNRIMEALAQVRRHRPDPAPTPRVERVIGDFERTLNRLGGEIERLNRELNAPTPREVALDPWDELIRDLELDVEHDDDRATREREREDRDRRVVEGVGPGATGGGWSRRYMERLQNDPRLEAFRAQSPAAPTTRDAGAGAGALSSSRTGLDRTEDLGLRMYQQRVPAAAPPPPRFLVPSSDSSNADTARTSPVQPFVREPSPHMHLYRHPRSQGRSMPRPTGHSLMSENATEMRRRAARQHIIGREREEAERERMERERERERDEAVLMDVDVDSNADVDTNREWESVADRRMDRTVPRVLGLLVRPRPAPDRPDRQTLRERLVLPHLNANSEGTSSAANFMHSARGWPPSRAEGSQATSAPTQDAPAGNSRAQGVARMPASSSEAAALFASSSATSSPAPPPYTARLSQTGGSTSNDAPTLPSLADTLTGDGAGMFGDGLWPDNWMSEDARLRSRADLRDSLEPFSTLFPSPSPSPPPTRAPLPPQPASHTSGDRVAATPEVPRPQVSHTRANINPEAYHDGPFRMTLGHLLELDRGVERRNQADVERALSVRGEGVSMQGRGPSPLIEVTASGADRNAGRAPSTDASSMTSRVHEHRRRAVPLASVDSRPLARADSGRDRGQLHDMLSRSTRMDGSRLPNEIDITTTGNAVDFAHAMDVLRTDGLTTEREQQLMQQFQRTRERQERARQIMRWGDFDGSNAPFGHRSTTVNTRRNREQLTINTNAGSDAERAREPRTIGAMLRGLSSPTRALAGRDEDRARAAATDLAAMRAERQERLRATRQRLAQHQHQQFLQDMAPTNMGWPPPRRRGGRFGEMMGDHEHQFHGFMTLAAAMQERAPPRGVPDQTIASLPTATFQEWATPDSDQMCPICFEDYNAPDPVLKLPDCNHWIHKPCLEKWLKTANTCPICRKRVTSRRPEGIATGPSRGRRGDDSDRDGGGGPPPPPPPANDEDIVMHFVPGLWRD